MPGGPFNDPKMSATAKANLSAYYGFDKPLLQQYLTYLNNLIHGNFGFSTKYPSRTVNDLLAGAFPYSADLGIRALCFAISFGLVFGIISALNRGNKIDLIFVIVAVFGTSVPDFIMGALLQHFFAVKWGAVPDRAVQGLRLHDPAVDPSSVIRNCTGTIFLQNYMDQTAVSCQMFIYCVIYDLINEMI
mgnify:CR=1 FL=1